MSRLRFSSKQRETALASAKVALTAMASIVDGLNVPFLKAAPQTVLQIVQMAEVRLLTSLSTSDTILTAEIMLIYVDG